MPPAATPKPGAPKQMPKWAWPVAIGGGLLVGFLFLRKGPPEEEGATEEPGVTDEAAAKKGGGGGSAIPAELREALGLEPPMGDWDGGGWGDGGADPGSEAQVQGDVTTDGQQVSYLQSALGLLPAYTTQPVSSGFLQQYSDGPTSPVSSGFSYDPGPTHPVSSGVALPVPSPSPAPTGSGSTTNKAM